MNPQQFQPGFLTKEMVDLVVVCPSCGRKGKPDFWQKLDQPVEAIVEADGGYWQRRTAAWLCSCGELLNLPVEMQELTHTVSFFGDEAYRDVGTNFVAVWSLLGGTSGQVRDAVEALAAAKRKVLPNLEPDRWRLHATEMLSGQKRLQHAHYKHLSRQAVEDLLAEAAEITKALGEWGWNACVTSIYQANRHPSDERKKVRSHLQRGMLLALLSVMTELATRTGLQPGFMFDATSAAAANGKREGWADETFLGFRHYLAYPFITHGNEVQPPEFVRPGSHPLLELADVHAYFVARSIEARITRKPNPGQLERFGVFDYIAFRGSSLQEHRGVDVPPIAIWS